MLSIPLNKKEVYNSAINYLENFKQKGHVIKHRYFWAFVLLMAIYITLVLMLPSDPAILKKYEISQTQSRWLNLTIVVPIFIVYFVAFYGFQRFRSYALSIKKTREGKPLLLLSTGLAVLAFSLPVGSIIGLVINYLRFQHTDLLPIATILRNYSSLAFQLVAFWYIVRGAQGLLSTLKNKQPAPPRPLLALLGPIVLASIFTWLITTQPHDEATRSTYYLPNIIVILTIAIPFVYIWCKGMQAAYNLYVYRSHVRGLLYKRAIDYLAQGIMVIIALSIFLQLFMALSGQVNRLDLTPLLLIAYVLVALYALGYGLVARGAKKLKQIEEA